MRVRARARVYLWSVAASRALNLAPVPHHAFTLK